MNFIATTALLALLSTSSPQQLNPQIVEIAFLKANVEISSFYYGVNPLLAMSIINAESQWNPRAKNPKSTASGLFQYIDGTFQSFCMEKYMFATSTSSKNDPKIQIKCGVKMLSEGLESHWNASRSGWQSALGK